MFFKCNKTFIIYSYVFCLCLASFTLFHSTLWLYSSPLIQFSHSVMPWTAARQAFLSITNSQSLLKLTSIKPVMPSSHLILCPQIPPSIRVFSNESALRIRWPKYWSFGFSIIPSKEHPGLISFRMKWLALLAVRGTLKSLLQHHSSKASLTSPQSCHPFTEGIE